MKKRIDGHHHHAFAQQGEFQSYLLTDPDDPFT